MPDARSIYPINSYIRDTTFTMDTLETLPSLDSSRPKPGPDLVPEIFRQRFAQWSALTHEHFSFNAALRAKLERTLWELKLDGPRSVPVVGCVPLALSPHVLLVETKTDAFISLAECIGEAATSCGTSAAPRRR